MGATVTLSFYELLASIGVVGSGLMGFIFYVINQHKQYADKQIEAMIRHIETLSNDLKDVRAELNGTREQLPKTYATKSDVKDLQEVVVHKFTKFEQMISRLDEKLDGLKTDQLKAYQK